MKTNKLSIVALTGLSAIMLLSCKKEVNTPTSSSEAEKATISGYAYAELDLTKGDLEFAPNGTKVILSTKINGKDYNYTGTVTDGKYSISIPVGRDSKNYTINLDSFNANQTIEDGSKKLKNYSFTSTNVTLIATQNVALDVTYDLPTDNNLTSFTKTVTIKGKLVYDSDDFNATNLNTNAPDGTKVYFGNDYVTTVTNGEFQFVISTSLIGSVSETINFEDFKANQTAKDGITVSLKLFHLSSTIGSSSNIQDLGTLTYIAQ